MIAPVFDGIEVNEESEMKMNLVRGIQIETGWQWILSWICGKDPVVIYSR